MKCVYTEVFKNRKWLYSFCLRSSGEEALKILECKLEATIAPERPRRM